MNLEFQIEYKSDAKDGYLFARLLNKDQSFVLTENSKLGGREIEPYIGIPRAMDKDGKPRRDLFAFHLKRKSDLNHFEKGQLIELSE